jgi:hypothetical protein
MPSTKLKKTTLFSKTVSAIVLLLGCLAFLSCTENSEKQPTQEKETTSNVASTPTVADGIIIHGQTEPDSLKGSLKAMAVGKVGDVNIKVKYHSPAVRNRVIWGGLIAYDQVWVTGAHSATTFETGGPILLGGQKVPAGKYALFTIPGKEEWTIILNRNWEQHLADEYSAEEDVIRLLVNPEQVAHQERLRYTIEPKGPDQATLVIHWERLRLPVVLGQ